MPRGKPKGGHKGRMKHYLTAEEIAEQEERKKREQEWKKKKGFSSGVKEEEDDNNDDNNDLSQKGTIDDTTKDSDSSEEESTSDEDLPRSKGVEGLIEISNPNRVQQKGKKVGNVDINATVELSRKEREEIQKQRDVTSYRRKHEAGLTDEAQRDLARLAIIKQQREEAKKKKEAEIAAAKERKK